jgi:hypothetical protein
MACFADFGQKRLASGASRADMSTVSTVEHAPAPRAVDVLPSRVSRRLTRRDGLLPLVLTLELLVGVLFGIVGAS